MRTPLLCSVSHTPKVREYLQSSLPRREIAPQLRGMQCRLDDEADLARMLRLDLGDGGLNIAQHFRSESAAGCSSAWQQMT